MNKKIIAVGGHLDLMKKMLREQKYPNVEVEIQDERPNNIKGEYHGKWCQFVNVQGALFVKYGSMKTWERMEGNNEMQPGKISLWAKVTGQPDDISMNILHFKSCLEKIGMGLDEKTFSITNVLYKPN